MQCMQALKLSVTALLAFVGIAATQPDANDPTLVKLIQAWFAAPQQAVSSAPILHPSPRCPWHQSVT